ncbi:MAG TPA: ABC transporter permease [Chitinophagaceae bacterium]|jgi:ABC-2 type transport system permease protein|nr:ABC transporter permease [Chitinophagaceae bacterium]
MPNQYSQFTALKALTKGSLQSLLKSPSAIFFSIAFPLIFISAFGLMSNGGYKADIAFEKDSDTLNYIYKTLSNMPVVNVLHFENQEKQAEEFKKGKIAAILSIKLLNETQAPYYSIDFKTSNASGNDKNVARQLLNSVLDTLNKVQFPDNKQIAVVNTPPSLEGREYKYLDFFLPGMLGFSMLSAGIFGTAFVFFTLRQTLVLKRFFATPVKRIQIILSEGIARLLLQLMSSSIIILVGHFAFGFTLVHGINTFFQMLVLCCIGLVLFLGMGFVISSLAKNEAMIPPLANMITMPQLLLSGVFLGVSNFPSWLQPFCKILPLTQLNDAMRAVAFEGKSIMDCWQQIGIMGIWGIVVYIIAVKVFKWE